MIKLAYITTLAETQWGFLAGQNRFMAAHGFELHSISSPGPYVDELIERDGVQFHPVKISRQIRLFADLLTLIRLFIVLRRIRPDIVHLSTSKAAILGAAAAFLARVPVRIFLVRGLASENSSGIRRRLFQFLEWFAAKTCHETICVAPSLLAYARKERILGDERGKIIANGMSNGVDVEHFDPDQVHGIDLSRYFDAVDDRTKVVGYFGRIDRDKGIEEIVTMWQEVREAYPNSLLLLVGRWDSQESDNRAAREVLEQDDRVVMTGWVEDVAPYYRVTDVVVVPTHGTEGFPNVPMQASCMGLPVIASKVVGCVDAVVDGQTGRLIEPRNSAALTEAVRHYFDNPLDADKHGRQGRDRVLNDFTREAIWQGLLEEYLSLLQSHLANQPAEQA